MLWKPTHKLVWTKWQILYNSNLINRTKAKNKSKSLWLRSPDRVSCSSSNQRESKAIINQTNQVMNQWDKVFSQYRIQVLSNKNLRLNSKWCSSSNNKKHKTESRIQETKTKVSIKLIKVDNKSSKTNNSQVNQWAWTIMPNFKVSSQSIKARTCNKCSSNNNRTFNSNSNNQTRFRKWKEVKVSTSNPTHNNQLVKTSNNSNRAKTPMSISNNSCKDFNKTNLIPRTSATTRVTRIQTSNFSNNSNSTMLVNHSKSTNLSTTKARKKRSKCQCRITWPEGTNSIINYCFQSSIR